MPKLPPAILRPLTMMSLILAGEAIFLPVFHSGRYFKSSLLGTLDINEFQLGQLGAIYGVFATASYFLGGPLADRYPPRLMIIVSLVLTALGSFYLATIPSWLELQCLFAFWGVTTIFAFWAPLIPATREWAGEGLQASAFGILDAGRGLTSAGIASLAALYFARAVGSTQIVDPEDEYQAIVRMSWFYAGYCLLACVCVGLFVPKVEQAASRLSDPGDSERPLLPARLARILRSPVIWLQAVVSSAAYWAFKMLDNYGLYAEDD